MKLSYFFEIFMFLVLIALQVLFFQHISLFGVATPILYIYFLMKLPLARNPFFVIISVFLLGFIIDIFLNTPGMNAAATTIMALLRPVLLRFFYSKEESGAYIPSINTGTSAFIQYAIAMVFLHQLLLFFIESFTFFNFQLTIIRILASSVITLIVIFSLDGLIYKKPTFE